MGNQGRGTRRSKRKLKGTKRAKSTELRRQLEQEEPDQVTAREEEREEASDR